MIRVLQNLGLVAAALCCVVLLPLNLMAQSGASAVDGYVRDAQKQPLPGVKVWLDDQIEGRTQSTLTDAAGHFQFPDLSPGTYMLRAQKSGYLEVTHGPLVLKQGETTSVNLQLAGQRPQASPAGKNPADAMEYSDEPNFTVAGVSDPSDVGGHGSNVTLPTKEALAKDTASLTAGISGSGNHDEASESRATGFPIVSPQDFATNLSAGENLLQAGRPKDAITYLEKAAQLQPGNFEANDSLAQAYLRSGDPKRAEVLENAFIAKQDRAGAHALLAAAKEAEGLPVEAVKEYQRAAEMDPSEPHLFSWAAELLLHHAYQPASEVFAKGHRLYPKSIRILVGLSATAYAQDLHDQAARWLLNAIALEPSDPRPYEFLGKVQEVAKSEPPEWAAAFERFASLQPGNAHAHYFYAVALEKQRRGAADFSPREAELRKAIALDSKFGDAYLHLGLLQIEQRDFVKAVESLQRAVDLTSLPDEAHLRLAQVYRELGEAEKARQESQLYSEVSEKKKAQLGQERHELGQFVYTMQGDSGSPEKPAPKPQ
jgi:tetratricopeptide (TPR) repeat protein